MKYKHTTLSEQFQQPIETIVKRGKKKKIPASTHIHDRSLSWLGTKWNMLIMFLFHHYLTLMVLGKLLFCVVNVIQPHPSWWFFFLSSHPLFHYKHPKILIYHKSPIVDFVAICIYIYLYIYIMYFCAKYNLFFKYDFFLICLHHSEIQISAIMI